MSIVKMTERALDRIAADEDRIRAFVHIDRATALAEAHRLERAGVDGPLTGEVIGIKDLFETVDMPTECGSPIYKGRRAMRDAAAVAAIRAAGGLIVGKTVTTEFAYMTPGPTRNPHNPEHTPGGSSSGSAASVAAGGLSMAIGTQTAGSIIRPAAFCGIVGFKPSLGTISRSGLSLFGETLDTIGGFGRDVATAARFVGVMADQPALIAPVRSGAPKLAVWRTPDVDRADSAAVTELERVAGIAAKAGAEVRDFDGGAGWSALQRAHATIMAYEGARALAYEHAAHPDLLSPALRDFLTGGAKIDGAAYFEARRSAIKESAKLLDAMSGYDAVLTLSAAGEAPLASTGTGDPHFNRVWTLVGGPTLHVPTGSGPMGLPLGVQICGQPQEDARTVGVALWLEALIA